MANVGQKEKNVQRPIVVVQKKKMLQLLSLKDSTTKIGSNMDMDYTESKMALDYGNTVYRDSTSGI